MIPNLENHTSLEELLLWDVEICWIFDHLLFPTSSTLGLSWSVEPGLSGSVKARINSLLVSLTAMNAGNVKLPLQFTPGSNLYGDHVLGEREGEKGAGGGGKSRRSGRAEGKEDGESMG